MNNSSTPQSTFTIHTEHRVSEVSRIDQVMDFSPSHSKVCFVCPGCLRCSAYRKTRRRTRPAKCAKNVCPMQVCVEFVWLSNRQILKNGLCSSNRPRRQTWRHSRASLLQRSALWELLWVTAALLFLSSNTLTAQRIYEYLQDKSRKLQDGRVCVGWWDQKRFKDLHVNIVEVKQCLDTGQLTGYLKRSHICLNR